MVLTAPSDDWGKILAALYLPGAPHEAALDRRRWPAVLRALRKADAAFHSAAECLHSAGFPAEALILEAPTLADWVQAQSYATPLDADYPERWVSRLAESAPPALWSRGSRAADPPRDVAIVGVRDAGPETQKFAAECARRLVDDGWRIVSGGAVGVDQAALGAARRIGGQTLVLVPFGLGHCPETHPGELVWSVCPTGQGFSTPRAMERNALVYAAGQATIVCDAHFKSGGTWHGAVGALRRRLGRVLVRRPHRGEDDDIVMAARSLVALGAEYLSSSDDLPAALHTAPEVGDLFSKLRAG